MRKIFLFFNILIYPFKYSYRSSNTAESFFLKSKNLLVKTSQKLMLNKKMAKKQTVRYIKVAQYFLNSIEEYKKGFSLQKKKHLWSGIFDEDYAEEVRKIIYQLQENNSKNEPVIIEKLEKLIEKYKLYLKEHLSI